MNRVGTRAGHEVGQLSNVFVVGARSEQLLWGTAVHIHEECTPAQQNP